MEIGINAGDITEGITTFDVMLELDEQALRERGSANLIMDESIRVLARGNTIGVSVQPLTESSIGDKKLVDMKMICVAQAHPECEYKWVTATIRFPSNEGYLIKDMSPRKVTGKPAKLTTTYNGGLSFEIEATPVKAVAELGKEQQTEKEIFYPEVIGSGVGFSHAQWEFSDGDHAKLHVDRELRLLVEHPGLINVVKVTITLRAEVFVKGILSYIPLVGRKEEQFEMSATFQ